MQYGFRCALHAYCGLLLKGHLPRTQEKLERIFWSIILKDHRSFVTGQAQVSLLFLTGDTGIVNVQGCGMHWYLS